ncbi:MAG: ABC transporter permease [Saccharopolyspora sp.]|uniref:MlaE family ABC transporter permease n=1 Tax=Saccharopolyspora TaxID=1835 RepID=UPI00190BF4A6|nr:MULTISPECIES: ABC transporter permease [unclassified Saccharopolyspora]MBK0867795.1 ABC transporter permease [Saccharopolyspora sp. HNM0986]MBQ6639509.1 ABC transporter permease [Saccharopolyspora sp.]
MALEIPPSRGAFADAATQAGLLVEFAVTTLFAGLRALVRGRLSWRECLAQGWFLASVSTLPAVLMTIPLGVLVAVNIGALAGQLGAEGYAGAVVAFVVVGQASPLVCALMISGVGGSAICADLGARKLREETDAMEVMGISTVERLVVPRVLAAVVVTVLLDGVVMAIGISATLFVHVLMGGSAGGFLATLTAYSDPGAFLVAEVKAAAFGVLAALVSAFKGLTAKGGPSGLGDAVNEAVVMAFVMVFVANVVLTELHPLLLPPKGDY